MIEFELIVKPSQIEGLLTSEYDPESELEYEPNPYYDSNPELELDIQLEYESKYKFESNYESDFEPRPELGLKLNLESMPNLQVMIDVRARPEGK